MKKINLIITAGIAASKAKALYLQLKEKYDVRLVLTKNASKFFDTKGLKIYDEIFDQKHYFDNHVFGEHLQLAFDADCNIVYPATYNYIGKISNGIADDMPSLLFAASKCPTFIFPSMNFNMYENPILEINKQKLQQLPNVVWVNAKYGKMASGHVGVGRALEPEEVKKIIDDHFLMFNKFNNKKLLLNLGKTRSWIDAVRYITNASTGKMGLAIQQKAKFHFKSVKTVFGDNDFNIIPNENNIYAQTNPKMLEAMLAEYKNADVVICSAALYDFEVKDVSDKKIEKRSISNDQLKIDLETAVDVLYELGKQKQKQFLVGFSLANDFDLQKAKQKLDQKNLDMLIINLTSAIGSTNNHIKIILKNKKDVLEFDSATKDEIALKILEVIHDNI